MLTPEDNLPPGFISLRTADAFHPSMHKLKADPKSKMYGRADS
jgi:hypothetical protein